MEISVDTKHKSSYLMGMNKRLANNEWKRLRRTTPRVYARDDRREGNRVDQAVGGLHRKFNQDAVPNAGEASLPYPTEALGN